MMTPGGVTSGAMGDWLLSTRIVLWIISGTLILMGIYEFFFGFGRSSGLLLGMAGALLCSRSWCTYQAENG